MRNTIALEYERCGDDGGSDDGRVKMKEKKIIRIHALITGCHANPHYNCLIHSNPELRIIKYKQTRNQMKKKIDFHKSKRCA